MDETPKRFDRIIAILIQLQSRRIIKAQDLAERFEVSLRTIYRDIRTLEASGVPIYSEAGVGYSLMEGYRLPPVMFTREEAASFIAAEKLMQKFSDKEMAKHYESAAFKLKAVLRSSDKDWVSNIESSVMMQPKAALFNENAPNALAVLFKSIAEKKQTKLLYRAFEAEAATQRIIEPVGIFHDHDNWYVFAFCHLRDDYRQFRTDRIHSIWTTDDPFTKEHLSLEAYLKHDGEKVPTTRVRIEADRKIKKYMDFEKKYHGFVEERMEGDFVQMTFLCRNIDEGFARWYLTFGDHARIIEPESLKERVLALMEKMQTKILTDHQR
ncbi:putative DNA-binding transcriptional regulator YafY [Arcticibacter pallidicorallinus]|uniref:Putative DNA-binding transcriptional regulator YafY n=1 Tax=Arcticibacter pallidicorallinus TaxID=1259464 RepID=A0A2T0U4E5_9SPHI|nr:YafY family protein [Arcticibacter pallidicorallinus]PRY52801.1 putative DNA-binding transcriptional regulator YafY [Arcticibacter pallidicorallinus]